MSLLRLEKMADPGQHLSQRVQYRTKPAPYYSPAPGGRRDAARDTEEGAIIRGPKRRMRYNASEVASLRSCFAPGVAAPWSTSWGSAPIRPATDEIGASSSASRPSGAPPSCQYSAKASRVNSSNPPPHARTSFRVRKGKGSGNRSGSPSTRPNAGCPAPGRRPWLSSLSRLFAHRLRPSWASLVRLFDFV